MLALARADAGQHPLKFEEFYLNDLVEDACRAAQVLAVRKGVALRLDLNEDIAFSGDEVLLRRLIMNLLDNAIKYTPAGGSVSVRLISEPDRVKFIVSDTGIGIPADAAPYIFERFYRADKARSRADGGSGLGLAIARWVAEAHKGSIDLVSNPDHGSKFIVSLPR
jgi:signal transduction histidine kinase